MKPYFTVDKTSSAEYSEKRSRFIGEVFPCDSEENAARLLGDARTRFWDAKHHVYAYILKDGTMRFSDDGEPHGTAGKPVLDALSGSGLVDTIVIVTRYFGGTLLGTGGLVHAYSTAANDALKAASRVEMCPCVIFETVCPYPLHASLERLIRKHSAVILSTEFAEQVTVRYQLRDDDQLPHFTAEFIDAFCGRLSAEEVDRNFFAFSL